MATVLNPRLKPWLYGEDRKPMHPVDRFVSLMWCKRYSTPGEFELYLDMTQENYNEFTPDRFIWLEDEAKRVMVAYEGLGERGSIKNYGLHVGDIMIIENRVIESSLEDGDVLKVTGRELTALLDRRAILEFMPLPEWPKSHDESDVRSGLLWNEMLYPIFSYNVTGEMGLNGSLCPRERVIDWLDIDLGEWDSGVLGLKAPGRFFHGENILDVFTEYCDEYDIGMRFTFCDEVHPDYAKDPASKTWNPERRAFFELYLGNDRTSSSSNPCVFAYKNQNLISSTYYETNTTERNFVRCYNKTGDPAEGDYAYPTFDVRDKYRDGRVVSGVKRKEIAVDCNRQYPTPPEPLGSNPTDEQRKSHSERAKQYEADLKVYNNFMGLQPQAELNREANKAEREMEASVISDPAIYAEMSGITVGDRVTIIDKWNNIRTARITEWTYNEDSQGYSTLPTFTIID